jgi:acetylornithine deacetylase/succinyl-diaminopimelate desuccinylase-like protein
MKSSDSFAHGLNERIPVGEIAPAITFYKRVITELAK